MPDPGAGSSLRLWRAAAIVFACLSLVLTWSLLRLRPDSGSTPDVVPEDPPAPLLTAVPAGFDELPGWSSDTLDGFAAAFLRSCGVYSGRSAETPVGSGDLAGVVGDWSAVCGRMAGAEGESQVRRVLEEETRPWALFDRADNEGFLTGYYEATLHGSRTPDERYRVPLLRRPPEMVTVDLGAFRDDLQGRRLSGSVEGDRLQPMPDRRELEEGALGGRALELLYVDDEVDAFFLHIQGSGRVELDDGGFVRVGYAAQNGHPYLSIGRVLVERGELELESVTMQSIRRWLDENPEGAADVMRANPSFVFFRELGGEGPVGSQGVVVTPRRSLAVDRRYLPLGVPVWLDTTQPPRVEDGAEVPMRRLVVAQDTGGAIRGPLRGDFFWGHGDEASERAGRMRHAARWWVLLPRSVVPTVPSSPENELSSPEAVG